VDHLTIANEVTGFLTPFVPYLLEAGKYAAGAAAKKFGEAAWNGATALWQKLRPKVDEKPALREALEDLARTPNDEDVQAAARVQVRKSLAGDLAVADDLARILENLKSSGVTVIAIGERSVATGGDIANSTIHTGDISKIRRMERR